jgi:hypothetical protein
VLELDRKRLTDQAKCLLASLDDLRSGDCELMLEALELAVVTGVLEQVVSLMEGGTIALEEVDGLAVQEEGLAVHETASFFGRTSNEQAIVMGKDSNWESKQVLSRVDAPSTAVE